MYYIGLWTFPRRDFSYVLKIQCQESGVTGQREALVLDRELAPGHLRPTQEVMKSWAADPYDPTCQQGILRNLAEDEQYDAEFPDHPLSRLRRYFQQIEPTIAVADALKQSPEFRGPRTTRRHWWQH